MANLQPIPFGGLQSRTHDHLIELHEALYARDCILDQDIIEGRPGYRSVTASAVASTGIVQHAGRFRGSASSARTVMVIAGQVWVITDPSSETASDGTATSLGTPFSDTAIISGTQLGTNYYLSTDQDGVAWRRITWTSTDTYALETLSAIPQGTKPSGSAAAPSWIVYRTAGLSFTDSGVTRANDAGSTTWVDCDPTAAQDYTYVDLGSPSGITDMSTADWLLVGVTPFDTGSGGGIISIWISEDASTWTKVGSTKDVPPAGGSPNIVFCDLRFVSASLRNAVRYVKFVAEDNGNNFGIYGHMLIPTAPVNNPEQYIVTFFNSSTLDESRATDVLKVEIGTSPLPVYVDRYYTSGSLAGSGSVGPLAATNPRNYNKESGLAYPSEVDIGKTVTITGTAPTFSTPSSLIVRLYKMTPTGYRLVTDDSVTVTTGQSYTVKDFGGLGVLSHASFRPGGSAPKATAITSHAQRIIALYQNRVYISSYVPTSGANTVYPQWPDIATEDFDGWSFDIAPSPKEQGMIANGEGDAVYIVTTESCYAMTDLRPNSEPYLVFRRGAVSRRGGGFWEDRFFWEAWDGCYVAAGKSDVSELTETVRRHYQETLIADCHSCIGYNYRERALYLFADTRYLRWHFPSKTWTSGTLANNVRFCLSWKDA